MAANKTPVTAPRKNPFIDILGPALRPSECDAFLYRRDSTVRDNQCMRTTTSGARSQTSSPDHRLRKHADYQRVYREGRKQFSPSMSYFFSLRSELASGSAGPRIGLTAGKVLGKAVERNRIKRRMRDIVRRRAAIVHADVDIVLHPRKSVLTMDFAKLESEIVRIFSSIQAAIDKQSAAKRAESKDEL